jgi:glyoxylase-like metal-dependent hydrolase (beta-lactamase superfamily II)
METKIADRWFELARCDDGVTRLWEPHVHPWWQSNIWHIRGRDRDLLVDSGMGVGDLRGALQSLIDKPVIAVATHRHSDHTGGLHQFEDRWAHEDDAAEVAYYTGFVSLRKSDYPPAIIRLMAEAGATDGDELVTAYPYEGYDPGSYRVKPAPPTRVIREGDTVDLGDRAFTVLHLPGHTPGSIGLFESATGILFSGDAVYDGELLDFLPESNIDDYRATMRRLRELPASIIHGGHDPSFGRERLIAICDEYLTRRAA